MKTRQDYISILQANSSEIRQEFGVKSLRIFGSVARNEHHEGSDVDVCVEMSPKMFVLIRLKNYLENLLDSSVDVVRIHAHINPFLKSEIDRDGITIFQ
jgi:hypothetical protein